MKNYLKFGILLLGIPLLLFNCEKENLIEDIEQQKYKATYISFQKFEKNNNSIAKTIINNNQKNSKLHVRDITTSDSSIIIDTVNILKVSTQTRINYTFKIKNTINQNTLF